mgnify:CR=1 FL=1
MKICKQCNQEKPIIDFSNKKDEKDGKHRYCKPCMKIQNDNWYQNNKINRTQYYKQYREENKEYFNTYCHNHYHSNKDLYREWNRNQYSNNIEYKLNILYLPVFTKHSKHLMNLKTKIKLLNI